MDVSVIVVTYNQEETIARTLRSVLSQQFDGSYEVVIGDDCSTDGTRAVCEEFAMKFPDCVRYIRREHNVGVTENYFGCIRACRGRYLADCAGDDQWVDDGKLAREFKYLEAHPEVTAVYTDWLCCNPDGSGVRRHPMRAEVREVEVYERGEMIRGILTNRLMPHLCTSLYRKDIIERYVDRYGPRFMSPWYVAEDPQIIMALSAAGRVAVLPGVSLHYSVGGDSVSRRKDLGRRLRHFVRETGQQLALADLFGVSREDLGGYLRRKLDYMWSLAWRSGDREAVSELRGMIAENKLKGGWKSKLYRLISMKNLEFKI